MSHYRDDFLNFLKNIFSVLKLQDKSIWVIRKRNRINGINNFFSFCPHKWCCQYIYVMPFQPFFNLKQIYNFKIFSNRYISNLENIMTIWPHHSIIISIHYFNKKITGVSLFGRKLEEKNERDSVTLHKNRAFCWHIWTQTKDKSYKKFALNDVCGISIMSRYFGMKQ